MAHIEPHDRQDNHNPELPLGDQLHPNNDPAGSAFRLQLLILIRYLCDHKQVPVERFREAERELNLTDVMARERATAIDNPRHLSSTTYKATAAVLIHTLFATQAAEASE